jgi:hypothetical protein
MTPTPYTLWVLVDQELATWLDYQYRSGQWAPITLTHTHAQARRARKTHIGRQAVIEGPGLFESYRASRLRPE